MVEPEWTDLYRDLVLGLDLHDREKCPGCGMHPAVLSDTSLHLSLVDTYCEMCKTRDRHRRRVEAREHDYEKKHKDLAPAAPRPNDGLHVKVRPLSPAEIAERRQKRRRNDG